MNAPDGSPVPVATITDFDRTEDRLLFVMDFSLATPSVEITPDPDGAFTDVVFRNGDDSQMVVRVQGDSIIDQGSIVFVSEGAARGDVVEFLAHELTTGSDGDDNYDGESGYLNTLEGNDSVTNTGRDSIVFLGDGDDTGSVAGQNVGLWGDDGDDELSALAGSSGVAIYGDDGDDTLSANGENAVLTGDAGDDVITASGTDIHVSGGFDDDEILITGEDIQAGGDNGNDRIVVEGENVAAIGGFGDDVLIAREGAQSVRLNDTLGNNSFETGLGTSIAANHSSTILLNLRAEDTSLGPMSLDTGSIARNPQPDITIDVPADWPGGTDVTVTVHTYRDQEHLLEQFTVQIGDHVVLDQRPEEPLSLEGTSTAPDLPDFITINVV